MDAKILLIDDDEDDRDFFREAVESLTYPVRCYTLADGRTAFRRMDNHEMEMPDLIFLDVNMPVMDGWDCLKYIMGKKEYRDIPVIMYSTSSYPEDISRAKELGAFSFCTKPTEFRNLKSMLERAVGSLLDGTFSSLALESGVFIGAHS